MYNFRVYRSALQTTTLCYHDKTAVLPVEFQTNLREDFTITEKGLLLVESAVTFNSTHYHYHDTFQNRRQLPVIRREDAKIIRTGLFRIVS